MSFYDCNTKMGILSVVLYLVKSERVILGGSYKLESAFILLIHRALHGEIHHRQGRSFLDVSLWPPNEVRRIL